MIMINKNPDPKAMLKQLGCDAINLLAMCNIDSAAEVKPLEAGIRLVGKAWDLPEEDVQAQLDGIAEERESVMFQIPKEELPEDELLIATMVQKSWSFYGDCSTLQSSWMTKTTRMQY